MFQPSSLTHLQYLQARPHSAAVAGMPGRSTQGTFHVQRDALANARGRGREALKIWRELGRAVMTARFDIN